MSKSWAKQHCNHVRARAPYRSCAAAEQTRMTRPAGDGEERALGRCQPEFLNAEMIRQGGQRRRSNLRLFRSPWSSGSWTAREPPTAPPWPSSSTTPPTVGPLPLQRWPVESSPQEAGARDGRSLARRITRHGPQHASLDAAARLPPVGSRRSFPIQRLQRPPGADGK